jgi:hypothetical protein
MTAPLKLILSPEVRAKLGLKRKPPQSITLRLDPSILVEKQEIG